MARGKSITAIIVVNNKKDTTVTKTIEPIVINGALVADPAEVEPGVNSRYS